MGLDSVEILMDVEEEFKISFFDSDAEEITTVGQLVDAVYARLRHNAQESCPSQHGFYIVRKQMIETLGLKRSQIKPETKLEDVISRKDRPRLWRDLIRSIGGKKTGWPSLGRPRLMGNIVGVTAISATIACVIALMYQSFLLSFLSALAGVLAVVLTIPYKKEIPKEFSQVKDLIRFVTTLDPKIWTKEEIFQKLKTIIVKQLGIDESKVTLDANFMDDLGVS